MGFTSDDDVEITITPRKDPSTLPRKGRAATPAPPAAPARVHDDGDAELTVAPETPYEGKEGWETFEAGEVYVTPRTPEAAPATPGPRKRPSEPMPEGTFLFNTGRPQADADTEVYTSSRREHAPASDAVRNNAYGVMEASGRTPLAGAGRPAPAVAARADGHVPRPAPASDADTLVYVSGRGAPTSAPQPRAPAGQPSATAAHGLQASAGLPRVKPGPLKVLLIGSGGREHAMAAALRRSPGTELFVCLRHRNPGLVKLASGFRMLAETDVPAIVEWARAQRIDLAVVGPEAALEAGLVDALLAAGIPAASPTRAAARIETDKSFMRQLMERHQLPGRLAFQTCRDEAGALAFLDQYGPVWAVKPIGLTGGKGVQVHGDHFTTVEQAKAYVRTVFASGEGGGAVQFEEVARGEEFTLMAFSDGTRIVPMPAVQDHKRLRDGDEGPNTGGMGSYTQADGLLPFLTPHDYAAAAAIVQAIVDALRAEGTPFVGTIYGQFMLTAAGPKVIEVNARFGDPEAINALHLLETSYTEILRGMASGSLEASLVRFRPRATVVRYVVPRGYGEAAPAAGRHIEVDEFNIRRAGGTCYYAHVEQSPGGPFLTMRSRTLAILGEGATIAEAEQACTRALHHVHGEALFARMDIGTATLLERRVRNMEALRAQGAQASAR